jgi:5'-3' exonuclease
MVLWSSVAGKGKVLIDGDIIAYRAAFATQDFLPKDAEEKVDALMKYVLDETIELPFPSKWEYQTYLTGSTNFRFDIAKSYPYKGNRKANEKPKYLKSARDYMVDKYSAVISVEEEADDLIGIGAAELGYNCVVASIDKDMLQLPCWHFNFVKGEWSKVDQWGGDLFFYTQVLTGDAADNIKGLKGIGPKKAEKLLQGCKSVDDLWEACVKAYDGDTTRIIENARLLWLRRYEGELWEPPVTPDDVP